MKQQIRFQAKSNKSSHQSETPIGRVFFLKMRGQEEEHQQIQQ